MIENIYDYVIVGAGTAAGNAVEGIRNQDPEGSILLIGKEAYLPYNRPDLSKKLWFGKKKVDQIYVNDEDFYTNNNVDVLMGIEVVGLNTVSRSIRDKKGSEWGYEKLLLAGGGSPRRLDIPGGDLEGISYYRYLDDYYAMKEQVDEDKTAVVIGGGFIGSELAASLTMNKVSVTMVYPEDWMVQRVFPQSLGEAVESDFKERGISILKWDVPVKIEKLDGNRFLTTTRNGKRLESDILIVGAGIIPDTKLAADAGLKVGNGIVVDDHLRTSDPNVYAAGDNAFFPYIALGKEMRVEHWDNAVNQGRHAGWNMAGKGVVYDYMPYFFSDLFDFGYEAVGELDSRMDFVADWETENQTGVIYYLDDRRVRGVMTCNIYGKMDQARQMIREGKQVLQEQLCGVIQGSMAA
jgi:NAD(P)H-nitrite reductase large subunit